MSPGISSKLVVAVALAWGLAGSACSPAASGSSPAPSLQAGETWQDPKNGITWVAPEGKDFLLARSEVTVGQYRACVAAGACKTQKLTGTEWKERPWGEHALCEWGRSGREDHPMNCVDWHQAKAFCSWAGGELLSRDEWLDEAQDGGSRTWPWGEDDPTCERAVIDDWQSSGERRRDGCGALASAPVCSRPAGNSRSGLCDMAGNVSEWTRTRELKETPPCYNMGGSWDKGAELLSVDWELINPTLFRLHTLGLRCRRGR